MKSQLTNNCKLHISLEAAAGCEVRQAVVEASVRGSCVLYEQTVLPLAFYQPVARALRPFGPVVLTAKVATASPEACNHRVRLLSMGYLVTDIQSRSTTYDVRVTD